MTAFLWFWGQDDEVLNLILLGVVVDITGYMVYNNSRTQNVVLPYPIKGIAHKQIHRLRSVEHRR
jgi:hypothetical protein